MLWDQLRARPHGFTACYPANVIRGTELQSVIRTCDGSSGEVQVLDEDIGEVNLTFDLTSDMRTTHFGLRGRATTVFPVKSETLSALIPTLPHHNSHHPIYELVAKLYWPEEEHESEADILWKVYEIAEKDTEGKVKYHVPETAWFHKFEDTSTVNIRKVLQNAERGKHVLHITVSRKLRPITQLSGRKFLSAWWHIVVCHYALWGQNIHHCNVSPNNLMVYKTSNGRYIGTLIEFDFSLTRDSPSGQECTGTVPFMAIELLTKDAMEGKVKHLYRHDAESFLWILTWVSLRYEKGHLLRKGKPLDEWLKVDINTCREKKTDFLYTGRHSSRPSPSHKCSWKVVRSSLDLVGLFYAVKPKAVEPVDSETEDSDDSESESEDSEADEADASEAHNHVSDSLSDAVVFETWLQNKIHPQLKAKYRDVRVKST